MAYHREQSSEVNLTEHARSRMSSRGIREWQIEQVLLYGRQSHVRNSTVYAIGRKEIKEFGKFLAPCEGIHVLCSSDGGAIITTYRNHDMRGLKEIW